MVMMKIHLNGVEGTFIVELWTPGNESQRTKLAVLSRAEICSDDDSTHDSSWLTSQIPNVHWAMCALNTTSYGLWVRQRFERIFRSQPPRRSKLYEICLIRTCGTLAELSIIDIWLGLSMSFRSHQFVNNHSLCGALYYGLIFGRRAMYRNWPTKVPSLDKNHKESIHISLGFTMKPELVLYPQNVQNQYYVLYVWRFVNHSWHHAIL